MVALTLAALAAGCEVEEHALLLRVRSQGAFETLSVTVLYTDTNRIIRNGARPVRRSEEQLQNGEAVLVAIELDGPHDVRVHLTATDADGQQYIATRCYAVNGVVEHGVLLVGPLDTLDEDGDSFPWDVRPTCRDLTVDGRDVPCGDTYRCP